jgi:hypothetical protein
VPVSAADRERLNQALAAHWEHIDLERRNWTIPAEFSKSRKYEAFPSMTRRCSEGETRQGERRWYSRWYGR